MPSRCKWAGISTAPWSAVRNTGYLPLPMVLSGYSRKQAISWSSRRVIKYLQFQWSLGHNSAQHNQLQKKLTQRKSVSVDWPSCSPSIAASAKRSVKESFPNGVLRSTSKLSLLSAGRSYGKTGLPSFTMLFSAGLSVRCTFRYIPQ